MRRNFIYNASRLIFGIMILSWPCHPSADGAEAYIIYRPKETAIWERLNRAISSNLETRELVKEYLDYVRSSNEIDILSAYRNEIGTTDSKSRSNQVVVKRDDPESAEDETDQISSRVTEGGIVPHDSVHPGTNLVALARLATLALTNISIRNNLIELASGPELFYISTLITDGLVGTLRDDQLSRQLMQVAAKSDPLSAFRLGQMNHYGVGAGKEIASAIRNYESAAPTQPAAAIALAAMYDDGTDIPQDLEAAAKYYEMAMATLRPLEIENWREDQIKAASIAKLIQSRVNVGSDYLGTQRGKTFLRKVASSNSFFALEIGKIQVCTDCGISVDVRSAADWFRLSASKGNVEAAFYLRRLLNMFPDVQTKKTENEELSKTFTQKINVGAIPRKSQDGIEIDNEFYVLLFKMLKFEETSPKSTKARLQDEQAARMLNQVCNDHQYQCVKIAYAASAGNLTDIYVKPGLDKLQSLERDDGDARLALMDISAYYGNFRKAKSLLERIPDLSNTDDYNLRTKSFKKLDAGVDRDTYANAMELIESLSAKGDETARMFRMFQNNRQELSQPRDDRNIENISTEFYNGARIGYSRGLALSARDLSSKWKDLGNNAKALDFEILALNADLYLDRVSGITDGSIQARFLQACHLSKSSVFGASLGFNDYAIQAAKRALNLIRPMEFILAELGPDFQSCFRGLHTHHYRWLASLLETEGRKRESVAVLNMLSASEVENFNRDLDIFHNSHPAELPLTSSEAAAKELIDSVVAPVPVSGRRLYELTIKSSRKQLTLREQNEIAALTLQFKKREQSMNEALSKVRNFYSRPQKAELPDDTKSVLDLSRIAKKLEGQLRRYDTQVRRVALLHYAVLPDRMFAIVTTAEGQSSFSWKYIEGKPFTEALLKTAIDNFRSALKSPASDIETPSQLLYDILIRPVEEELKSADLILISADRELKSIPFGALKAPNYYMIERAAVAFIPPGGVIDVSGRIPNNLRMAAFGMSQATMGLPPLKAVEAEVKELVRDPRENADALFSGKIYLNDEFSEINLRAGVLFDQMNDRGFIHIATHFILSNKATTSFLALGRGEKISLSNFLNQVDFRNAELVTLSACETASMTAGGSELGLNSLASAAERAGAQAVVASLWSVNDLSTSALMYMFYDGIRSARGLGYAGALADAQRRMLRGDISDQWMKKSSVKKYISDNDKADFLMKPRVFSHPYFWAPFVVLGR